MGTDSDLIWYQEKLYHTYNANRGSNLDNSINYSSYRLVVLLSK